MKNFKTELKWGITLALITFLVFVFSYLLGWQTVDTLSTHLSSAFGVFLIGNLACLWFGLKEKKSLSTGMSYMDGIKTGVIISVIAALLGALFLSFFTCCINSEFLDVTTAHNIAEGMLEEGSVVNSTKFSTEFITHSLIIGTVFTLILSFFAKSKAA